MGRFEDSIVPRLQHWKSILWSRLIAVVAGVYFFLGVIVFIRDELFNKHPEASAWHIIDLIPAWSLSTWIVILVATLLIFALEGSYRTLRKSLKSALTALGDEYEADLAAATAQLTDKESVIAELNQQLTTPKLVPEILMQLIEELPHPAPHALNVIAMLVGDEPNDVLIKLSLRIRNANRVKTTATCSVYIKDRFGAMHAAEQEPIPDIRQYVPLDLTGPIEYGIPHCGWLFCRIRDRSEARIVAGTLTVSVTDGNGVVSTTSHNT
jgi:hypothetical protein